MQLTAEFDRESDGRWMVSVLELPGVHAYGASREEAFRSAMALSYSVLADEIEHGERDPRSLVSLAFVEREAA